MKIIRPVGLKDWERLTPDTLKRLVDYTQGLTELILRGFFNGGGFHGDGNGQDDGWIVSLGALQSSFEDGNLTVDVTSADTPAVIVLNDGTLVRLDKDDDFLPLTLSGITQEEYVYLYVETEDSPETITVPVYDATRKKEVVQERTKGTVLRPKLTTLKPTTGYLKFGCTVDGPPLTFFPCYETAIDTSYGIDKTPEDVVPGPISALSLAQIVQGLNRAIVFLESGQKGLAAGATRYETPITKDILKASDPLAWDTDFETKTYDLNLLSAFLAIEQTTRVLSPIVDKLKSINVYAQARYDAMVPIWTGRLISISVTVSNTLSVIWPKADGNFQRFVLPNTDDNIPYAMHAASPILYDPFRYWADIDNLTYASGLPQFRYKAVCTDGRVQVTVWLAQDTPDDDHKLRMTGVLIPKTIDLGNSLITQVMVDSPNYALEAVTDESDPYLNGEYMPQTTFYFYARSEDGSFWDGSTSLTFNMRLGLEYLMLAEKAEDFFGHY